jgi:hypothetical protein
MKNTIAHPRLSLLAGAFTFLPLCIGLAADTNSASSDVTAAQPTVATAPAPAKLPYGVDDVLKLSRAQIGDEIILNYVKNSGTIYNLGANDIVYLKTAGVSDKVISAMLDQRRRVEMAAQPPPAQTPAVANAPMVADANTVPAAGTYADSSATYAQAPLTPPASSAYVIPYSAAYPYYGPYGGYYGPYYGGYYGPGVTFAFGFGGGRYCYGGRGYYGGHGGSGGHHR